MPRRSILFTPEQTKRLNALAAKTDRAVNWHVRQAVEAYLKRNGKKK